VGHAGTLDPSASGVVVICLGTYTRLASLFLDTEKEYAGTVLFGRSTDSFDLAGRTMLRARVPADIVPRATEVLPSFIGTYLQEVPRYSAAKWAGKAMHKWNRSGVETPARHKQVRLHEAEIHADARSRRRIAFRLVTGSGFYVRSWARDLGAAVGVPAVLARLIRRRVGPYALEQSVEMERLSFPVLEERLVRGAPAIGWIPAVVVASGLLARLVQGERQPAPERHAEGRVAVVDDTGTLRAIASIQAGVLHPRVVLRNEAGAQR
jgi:tRNA pseudouridine55 synthase